MKKNNIIIFSLLLLLTIGIVTFNYSNQLVTLFVEGAAPNPGHSLTEIEGGADLATKTYVDTAVSGITGSNWTVSGSNIYRSSGNVGIGTASPAAELHVVGNIIASDPTADNHVATKKYVDGLKSLGVPAGAIMMFKTACPNGWTREAALDGRFPLGNPSYGTSGTTGSHTHMYSTLNPAGWIDIVTIATSSTSNIPYINVIWCTKN